MGFEARIAKVSSLAAVLAVGCGEGVGVGTFDRQIVLPTTSLRVANRGQRTVLPERRPAAKRPGGDGGGKILHGSKDNIGPRIGLAYRVNDKMSVRGGFGISYDNWRRLFR